MISWVEWLAEVRLAGQMPHHQGNKVLWTRESGTPTATAEAHSAICMTIVVLPSDIMLALLSQSAESLQTINGDMPNRFRDEEEH